MVDLAAVRVMELHHSIASLLPVEVKATGQLFRADPGATSTKALAHAWTHVHPKTCFPGLK